MAKEMIRYLLPYGGAVDIHGNITWRDTKEEHELLKKHLEISIQSFRLPQFS